VSALPEEAVSLVRECLGDGFSAQPLFGDMSVRAYFRISSSDRRSYILAYYPPELRAQLRRFLAAFEAVSGHGRPAEVVGSSESAVLQRDVGDLTIFDLIHENREEGVVRYREAVDLLIEFQKADGGHINPPFSADFFTAELEMTRDFYVERLMDTPATPRLHELLRTLAENVSRHPYVLCHRDYHGENVHLIKGTLYMIDYQDLRMGPDTYDLASLLRDRGVARILGEGAELELLDYYGQKTGRSEGLRHRYFETLLQRTIKILGSFAKLPLVRGRMHYLEFIPPTIDSLRRCLDELPEFRELAQLIPLEAPIKGLRERARVLTEQNSTR
jgi:aminoglycoside/choline kinase family phosphotransferase